MRGGRERDYHRLRMCVRLHIEQAQRSKKFRIQNEITEPWPKERDKILSPGERQDNVLNGQQMGLVQKESAAGQSEPAQEKMWSTRRSRLKHATGNCVLGRKGKEQASSSVPKVSEQTDVHCSNGRFASPETGARIPCLWGAKCKKKTSCGYRHPPLCRSYKSGNGCTHGHRCQNRHADGEEKPSKRSKKEGTQGAVAILKEK